MEFVSAHWDPTGKRWVGGAGQHGHVCASQCIGTDRAIGFILVTVQRRQSTAAKRLPPWGDAVASCR